MLLQYGQKSKSNVAKKTGVDKCANIRKDESGTKAEELQNLLGNSAVEAIMSEYVMDESQQGDDDLCGIPSDLKSDYENKYGYSLDDVTIHYNSDRPKSLDAYAYTEGSDIYIGTGQEKYLTHELNHVIQQKQGKVSATQYLYGRLVNADPMLENAADGQPMSGPAKAQGNRLENVIQLKSKNMQGSVINFITSFDIQGSDERVMQQLEESLRSHDSLEANAGRETKSSDLLTLISTLIQMLNANEDNKSKAYQIALDNRNGTNMRNAVEAFLDSISLFTREVETIANLDRMLHDYDIEDDSKKAYPLLNHMIACIGQLGISKENSDLLKMLVEKERKDVAEYWGQVTLNPQLSYDTMISKGMLWRMPGVGDKYGFPPSLLLKPDVNSITDAVLYRVRSDKFNGDARGGDVYLRNMSRANMHETSMDAKTVAGSRADKLTNLSDRIYKLLMEKTRVSHYTQESKLVKILDSDAILSKLTIESTRKKMGKSEHNTQSVDEIGFSNTGFVFAYLEDIDTKASVNHKYGKVRISFETKAIKPLLSVSTMQLFDIVQSASTTPHKSAHGEREAVESVRMYQGSIKKSDERLDRILSEAPMILNVLKEQKKITDEERRISMEIISTVIPVVMSGQTSAFVYGKGDKPMFKLENQLHKNFFYGDDMFKGLAQRAAMEILILEDAGVIIPADDKGLIRLVLNGLYKIQLLLPDKVSLKGADIDRAL